MSLDSDLAELKRLKHVQRSLQVPAEFWLRAQACDGQCSAPVTLVEQNGKGITCCAFKIAYDLFVDAQQMEIVLRQRIESMPKDESLLSKVRGARKRVVEGLALRRALPRDFTGTFIGRRRELLEQD
jgi:hypothetical protein